MKKIVLTGGGTAGHVTPNLALIPELKKKDYEISYIGTENGIEHELISRENIPYFSVRSGKLRRYLSKENLSDFFKVIAGISDAKAVLKKIKPDVVFSKGGFVSVPVVVAAGLLHIPVVVHESDITPGLANRLAMPFAKIICTTFPETLEYVKAGKGINTGTPIRYELFKNDKKNGYNICGFTDTKPVIMIMGGSQGSLKINSAIRENIKKLTNDFQVVHLCGKGNSVKELESVKGYKQFEYVNEELKDIFGIADIIVSRAGSNSISEFLALKKPCLLIPLSLNASRGDQILNAKSFEKQGFAKVLLEEDMTPTRLYDDIFELYQNKEGYISTMEKSCLADGVEMVTIQIEKAIEKN